MPYIPDPTNIAEPTDGRSAGTAAAEFRAFKSYIATLLGFPNGFNVFRKNAIINGDFNIWQRGTSFAAVTDGTYTADRWAYGTASTTAVFTAAQSTDVPTVAQAGRLFNYSLHLDCTTADAAIAAGDVAVIGQHIEGFNYLPLAQRAMTLSFWVKATKTGTYCVSFVNSGADRSYVAEYTVSAANTWEKKTINISASPSAGTWDYSTGRGLQVWFALNGGSTWATAADTWQTGNYRVTANQVNATDNIANDFRITGVQLESGSVATEIEYRKIDEELELCKRYYQIFGENFAGVMLDATTWEINGVFPLEFRSNPTVTVRSGIAARARYAGTDITVAAPTVANAAASTSGYWCQITNDAGRAAGTPITGRGQGHNFLQGVAEL